MLGLAYQFGVEGVIPQDYGEAYYWYCEAARKGYASSYYHLGMLYANGWGVENNLEKAWIMFGRAELSGVGDAVNARQLVVNRMSVEQRRALEPIQGGWLVSIGGTEDKVCNP